MHLAPKVVAFAIALALCIGLPALSIAAKSKNTAVAKPSPLFPPIPSRPL